MNMIFLIVVLLAALLIGLLAMSIRHFIPLYRGLKAPWWAPLLGPLLYLFEQFFTEDARPHRLKFLGYCGAFCLLVLGLVSVGAKG